MSFYFSLCLAAFLVDGWLLFQQLAVEASFWALQVARAGTCLLFAFSIAGLIPRSVYAPAPAYCLLAFACAFFIPLLGMPGVVFCLVPGLLSRRSRGADAGCKPVSRPTLPVRPAETGAQLPVPGIAHLSGALRHARDPQRRTAALIATLGLDGQRAAPLLRLAMKDRTDDVRLLAHILMSRRESAVAARIAVLDRQGGDADSARALAREKAMAHDYWELSCLCIPDSGTATTMRHRAREHAERGLAMQARDIDLHVLCGRIALHDQALDAAAMAFSRAEYAGLWPGKTSPLRAEIAFFRRRYAEVERQLALVAGGPCPLAVARQAAFWHGRERSAP